MNYADHMTLPHTRPQTVLEAIAAVAEVTEHGFIFVNEQEQSDFMPFCDMVRSAYKTASALQSLGLRRGDRLAIIVPDHPTFVQMFLGALLAGLVPVPIYPPIALARIETWTETTTGILTVAGAAATVTTDEIAQLLWLVAAHLGTLVITVQQVNAQGTSTFTPIVADPDDIAFLQFTSGSTSAPRGVMVSHRNIVENCMGIIGEFLRPQDGDIGLSWLPLYHDMGLIGFVLSPFFAARTVILLATMAFLKRPLLWFELIHRHRVTVTFAPSFAYAFAIRRVTAKHLAHWDLSCLKVAGCGAEPISPEMLRAVAAALAPAGFSAQALCPCYGMAEATLVVTYTRVGELWRNDIVGADRLAATGDAEPVSAGLRELEFVGCGAPLAGHAIRIVDNMGQSLAERKVGEIEFCGPSLTLGYYGDPDSTREHYLRPWLRTGDLGYIADGQLFITGRKKDLIIIHGRNYAPQQIEWVVGALPDIRTGSPVAFANASHQQGEVIVVVCESKVQETDQVERAIRARVRDELGLVIDNVVILPPGTLPKTSSGKIQRMKTRKLYTDGTLQHRAARRQGKLTLWLMLTRIYIRSLRGRIQYGIGRTLRTIGWVNGREEE